MACNDIGSSASTRESATSKPALLQNAPTVGCQKHRGARGFLSNYETKCPGLRTHYHFEITFSPDNRVVQERFLDELTTVYQLGDDLISIECPDHEYLISIPDKVENTAAVEFLKSTNQLNIGNIYFTTKRADEEPTFCGTPGYDCHDHYAASEVLIELRNLPLHLWTFKTVDHLLHPYCVVVEACPRTLAFVDLLAFRCICWTDTPLNIPSEIVIKTRSRHRNSRNMLQGLQMDVFTVLIKVINNPSKRNLRQIELLSPILVLEDHNGTVIAP